MAFVLSLGAAVASIPFVLGEVWMGAHLIPDTRGWAIILYTAIFPSLVAQVFYIRGVEAIGANRANLFINLVPLFGAGLAVAILGEHLLPYHFVALALVVGGITLAERARKARPA